MSTGLDAIEFMMAGADAVGVGSALYYRGPEAIREIANEIDDWLLTHGVEDVASIRGIAHLESVFLESPSKPPIPATH